MLNKWIIAEKRYHYIAVVAITAICSLVELYHGILKAGMGFTDYYKSLLSFFIQLIVKLKTSSEADVFAMNKTRS